ncbi:MAG: tetratricopeptide repeat protein [Anditalea sp.]
MDDILKSAVEVSQGFLGLPNGWSILATNVLVVVGVLLLGLFLSYKARKRILFNPWVNRYDPEDTELGKSIADLLLFKLRYIKRTHELSGSKLSLWNTFQDIPSFRQNLDKEIDLLASVQLGNYGKIVTGTFAFLFKIFHFLLSLLPFPAVSTSMGKRKLYFICHSTITVPKSEDKSTKYRINAIHYYEKTIELNKKHYVAHNNLANLYLEWAIQLKGQKVSSSILRNIKLKVKEYTTNKLIIDKAELLKKAISHCEEALKINPVYHIAFDNLGNAYYELGNFNKAYMAYQNALVYDPEYPEATNDQAMLFLVKEFEGFDENKAKERYKEALELVKEEGNRKKKLVEVFEKRKSTLNISENTFALEINQIKSAGI